MSQHSEEHDGYEVGQQREEVEKEEGAKPDDTAEEHDGKENGKDAPHQFLATTVEEFIRTEAEYRACLSVLWAAYVVPQLNLHANEPDMARRLQQYAGCVLNIIACHDLLHQEIHAEQSEAAAVLAARQSQTSSNSLAVSVDFPALLLRYAPSFTEAYKAFVENFGVHEETINDALAAASTSNDYRYAWMDNCHKIAVAMQREQHRGVIAPDTDVSFGSLCIMPMQRIVRYSLLLSDFVAKMEAEPHDAAATDDEQLATAKAALGRIYELCSAVNKSRQVMTSVRRLCYLASQFQIPAMRSLQEVVLCEADFTVGLRKQAQQDLWSVKLVACTVVLCDNRILALPLRRMDSLKKGTKRKSTKNGEEEEEEVSFNEVLLVDVVGVRNLASVRNSYARFGEAHGVVVQFALPVAVVDGASVEEDCPQQATRASNSRSSNATKLSKHRRTPLLTAAIEREETSAPTVPGSEGVAAEKTKKSDDDSKGKSRLQEIILLDEDELQANLWTKEIGCAVDRVQNGW